jgi:dolichyl-phosphate-mannose--protein O-mannosyl transferase
MRRSASLLIPLAIIFIYYGIWVGIAYFLASRFPALTQYLPIGGLDSLPGADIDSFEPVYTSVERNLLTGMAPIRLLLASIGATILAVPVSWAYFITSRARRIDQSFLQTIMVLPLLVTGIAMIVLNSIALAFSLAGVVAAVRFRFSLNQPSDAMYIFVAIGIGLGAGIGALGIAFVISLTFVLVSLVIWKLEYGKTLSGPFLIMLTRRDGGEDDY